MILPDLIGHIGNLGFIVGSYLVARKNKIAFVGFAWGNIAYIIQGFLLSVPSLILISVYLLSMDIFGYINWTKNDRK